VHIEAEPHIVFEYFTRPEAMVSWIGDYAVLDPRPGGEFTLDVDGVPVRGRYLEVHPPRRIVLSWGHAGSDRLPPGASTVEITLTPEREGTTVWIMHHLARRRVLFDGPVWGEQAVSWQGLLQRFAGVAAMLAFFFVVLLTRSAPGLAAADLVALGTALFAVNMWSETTSGKHADAAAVAMRTLRQVGLVGTFALLSALLISERIAPHDQRGGFEVAPGLLASAVLLVAGACVAAVWRRAQPSPRAAPPRLVAVPDLAE
jgi:uncharacterized protein YndB with AHSA1/START domain